MVSYKVEEKKQQLPNPSNNGLLEGWINFSCKAFLFTAVYLTLVIVKQKQDVSFCGTGNLKRLSAIRDSADY